jgi:hypothetical protein
MFGFVILRGGAEKFSWRGGVVILRGGGANVSARGGDVLLREGGGISVRMGAVLLRGGGGYALTGAVRADVGPLREGTRVLSWGRVADVAGLETSGTEKSPAR